MIHKVILITLALSTTHIVAQATTTQWQEEVSDFQFNNEDISVVASKVGKRMKKNFILDPNVRGKITIQNANPVTLEQAYHAFLAGLALNGYSTIQMGPYTVIRGSRNIQRDSVRVLVDKKPPNTYEMLTMIYTLKHADAMELAKTLRILPSKDGELTPFPGKNQLILTDFGTNLNRVWKTLRAIDQPGQKKRRKRSSKK